MDIRKDCASVADLVVALGADRGISMSEVSRICEQLDESVGAFRTRPLDHIAVPSRLVPLELNSSTSLVFV